MLLFNDPVDVINIRMIFSRLSESLLRIVMIRVEDAPSCSLGLSKDMKENCQNDLKNYGNQKL